MDEYLDEKEQWEAVKAWLRENSLWIIAGVGVGAAGLWGWRWYQERADLLGMQASAKYEQVLKAFEGNDTAQALAHLGELERDFPSSPYVDQAHLSAARSYVESGDLTKGAAELKSVAEHSKDKELATLARMRLARVQIAQGQPDAALATLNGPDAGAFTARFHEVRGDAYFAKGDKANALKEYLGAKTGSLGSSAEADPLDLKISDLSADTRLPPSTPPPTAAAAK